MRLDEIRSLVSSTTEDEWHMLPTDAPTYVHRFDYGSDERGEHIWGLQEHHSRATLKADIDVGIVWGMQMQRGLQFDDWGPNVGCHDGKVDTGLAEILYRGQPVERVQYVLVDNFHGYMSWPRYHYPSGATGLDGPVAAESITVSGWELGVISLIDRLGNGGAYGTPDDYTRRAGFTVV